MEIAFLIIALIIMIIGLVGAVLPVIPSIPIVYGGYMVYGLATGWRDYGLGMMTALGVVTLLTLLLDYLAGALGARSFGATSAGVIGSVLGAIIGLIVFNVIGMMVGIFGGAVLGELYRGRDTRDALRSGWGAFLGFLAGSAFKVVMALAMIGLFLVLVIT